MPRLSPVTRLLPLRRVRCVLMAATLLLGGCAQPPSHEAARTPQRLVGLLPADALLLGEQHDAPDHQRVHHEVVQALAARDALAALVLEMAAQGRSTRGLPAAASEEQVRAALDWSDAAWPWRAYGPAVMAAVRAGVPVLGANLSRAQMRNSMADPQFDVLLSGPALKAQQQLIRLGHCDVLPENQITPMTRVQIARDVAMAHTVRAAAVPDKTVLLLAGRGHVDRGLGIPRHLPPDFKARAIGIGADPSEATTDTLAKFDLAWPAAPGPDIDHCTQFKARGSGTLEKRQDAK